MVELLWALGVLVKAVLWGIAWAVGLFAFVFMLLILIATLGMMWDTNRRGW